MIKYNTRLVQLFVNYCMPTMIVLVMINYVYKKKKSKLMQALNPHFLSINCKNILTGFPNCQINY